MGLSSKKSKTSSQSTATSTATPNNPAWALSPIQSFAGNVQNFGNTAPQAVGPSALQRQAFNGASNLTQPNAATGAATDAMRGLLNYNPQQIAQRAPVTAGGAATVAGPDASLYQAATYGPSSVTAGLLRGTDLSGYMNPYEDAVVNTSLADLDRFRQGAITGNQAAATASGAFGGSRHGIVDAETNRGYIDQAGSLAAQLRSAGFFNAQDRAASDIDRTLGADTFNANAAQSAAGANAAATNAMRTGLLSDLMTTQGRNQAAQESAAGRSLTAGLANQQAGLTVDQANQAADMAGADFRRGAAGLLGDLGANQDASQRANLGLQSELGDQQRAIEQQNEPWMQQLQQLLAQAGLLGAIPLDSVSGRTTTGTENSSGTVKQGSSGLDFLNTLANIWGAAK